jgi:glycosyltransferase involved in cell wall biosynthesis
MKNNNIVLGGNTMISVITVCLNCKDELRDTIDSVLSQNETGIEYIIKDGGSTDGTIEVLESYAEIFKYKGIAFKMISCPDTGIYDAMNQALSQAEGDIINFLNAGDMYYRNDVLKEVYQVSKNNNSDILYGDSLWVLKNGSKYVSINNHVKLENGKGLNQQAVFYRKNSFMDRKFDNDFKILGDFEFFLYLINKGFSFYKINSILVRYNRYGVSSTNVKRTYEEQLKLKDIYHIKIKEKSNFRMMISEFINKTMPVLNDYLSCFHDLEDKDK